MKQTDSNTVRQIIGKHFAQKIERIERFPTGLCHYVYDIKLADALEVVLRISGSDSELKGGIFWNSELRKLDIPVPEILFYDIEAETKYSIHRKIPGNDLWYEYPKLSEAGERELAFTLAEFQLRVEKNIKGSKFGYASSYYDPTLKANWNDIILKSVTDSEKRIKQAGIFDSRYIDILKGEHLKFESYLKSIEPKGFLDDITTKNVIIHQGRLSGIVDTDSICFGDKLKHLGLTKMAFISLGYNTDYISHFIEYYRLDNAQKKAVEFYTLLFCVAFMSEEGHKYNKDEVRVDQKQITKLKEHFEKILSRIR